MSSDLDTEAVAQVQGAVAGDLPNGEPGAVADPGEPAAAPATPAALDEVLAELQGLRETFASKIRYDEVRERQVEAMHTELEQHRRSLHRELLRPVLTDLVRIYDDLSGHLTAPDDAGSISESARLAAYVRGSIEETLARNGVESYTVDEDAVDRRTQKVISVEPTDDPAMHRTVAERVRTGFRLDDKVLRPEWVRAYRFVPPVSTEPENQDDNDETE